MEEDFEEAEVEEEKRRRRAYSSITGMEYGILKPFSRTVLHEL
jgi:hypothetical protein